MIPPRPNTNGEERAEWLRLYAWVDCACGVFPGIMCLYHTSQGVSLESILERRRSYAHLHNYGYITQ